MLDTLDQHIGSLDMDSSVDVSLSAYEIVYSCEFTALDRELILVNMILIDGIDSGPGELDRRQRVDRTVFIDNNDFTLRYQTI